MAVSLTSSGVVFPASSSLSGTVNVLDDYEEGNTGGVMLQGGSAWANYGTSTGKYTRLGRNVFLMMREETTDPNGTAQLGMSLNYALDGYHRSSPCGLKLRISGAYHPEDSDFFLYSSSGSSTHFYSNGNLSTALQTSDNNIHYCYGQYYYITTAA